VQSEYLLSGSGWSAANLDRNANAVVSPEGVQNGTEIVATGSGGHPIYEDLSSTSNGTYTLSMFVKKGVNTSKGDLSDGYSTTSASFDLDTATINADTAQTLNPFIEPYNNGWYRVGYTFAVTANQSQPAVYLFDSSGNQGYTANGETMYIYGFQIESGSYATSYIPTYGTSVSRAGEYAYKSGVSGLIGQTEGSGYVEFEIDIVRDFDSDYPQLLNLSDGTDNNRISLFLNDTYSTARLQLYVKNGGGVQASIISSSITAGKHKVAYAYAANDFVLYMDGVQIGTDNAGSVPSCSLVGLNGYTGANDFAEAKKSQAIVFKTRLTNAELAALTTI
tara:strand:- start:76 stop:1080 length:1005 start_codon:yes stop_codon:yes gene_type:complete